MKLYDNGFSPFARKVRIVLELKGLAYETVDALDKSSVKALKAVNRRVEVPTMVDGNVTIVNSSDIVAYLEHTHSEPPVYPSDPAQRVRARAWERCADTVVDPIMINISYWFWADRRDEIPEGLKEAARQDLEGGYDALERDLEGHDFVCGDLSIADIALFPHITAVRGLGVSFAPQRHPRPAAWFKRMRGIDVCGADLERNRAYIAELGQQNIEREKIFWRGDRIEWLLTHGYHDWFMKEIAEGRAIWPGLGIPAA